MDNLKSLCDEAAKYLGWPERAGERTPEMNDKLEKMVDEVYQKFLNPKRPRIVLSGLMLDPKNWFMSAVDDPLDFDYDESDEPFIISGD